MNNRISRFGKSGTALLLIAALVAGCAGQREHREGMALIDEGRYEEGLSKLEEASKADPSNLSYRTALKRNKDQVIARLLATANTERATGRPDAARLAYEHILKIAPENEQAKAGLESLEMDQRHEANLAQAREAVKKGDQEGARAALKPVFLENPKNAEALALQRQIDQQLARESAEAPTLRAKFKKPVTLQFRDANVKLVFEALSRTSGINILLDKDVKPDIKTSIFVKDVSVEDTIDLILLQSQLEKKVLNESTVFIYPNTPAKLKDYQDLKIRSFHLTNADPKQMLTMLKTMLKTKDLFIHEKTNSIVMRDTPDAIRLAERMIADQDIPDPEVMLEVEVLEVSRTKGSELGIKWPDRLTLTSPTTPAIADSAVVSAGVPVITKNNTSTPIDFETLRHTPLNKYLVATPLSLTLNLLLKDSDTNVLASPRIRAKNREKAKIMIGQRVPVITNAVTPVSTGTPVVTGSVQYLDVGLKLEVEPDIHADHEVAIKVNLEVSSIIRAVNNPQSGTQAYEVGTRNASTVLQLRDGETQVLAGLIQDSERESADKVPGLGQIPGLGRLFSSHKSDGEKTEIILSITPRVVSPVKQPDAREVEYWSGTEATLRNTPVTLKPIGSVSVTSTGGASPRPAPVRPAVMPPVKPPVPAEKTGAVEGGPMQLSWQGPNQAKVGDRISLTLNTDSAPDMHSLGFLVNYDPSVLKAVDATEGSILKQGGGPSTFNKSIDQPGGQVLVDLSGRGPKDPGQPGTVATVTFEVLAPAPQSKIAVSRISSSGSGGKDLSFAAPEPHVVALVK